MSDPGRDASRFFEFSILAYLKPRQVVGSGEHEREDRHVRLPICGQRPRLGEVRLYGHSA